MPNNTFKGWLAEDDARYQEGASVTVGARLSLSPKALAKEPSKDEAPISLGTGKQKKKARLDDGEKTESGSSVDSAAPSRPPSAACYHPAMTLAQKKAWVAGIDVTRRFQGGLTCLHLAVGANDAVLIGLLAKAGADIEAKNDVQATPLLMAVSTASCHKAVKALVRAGAEVNSRDDLGASPLHYAALSGLKPSIKILIDSGADVLSLDNDGSLPADYALMGGFLTIAEFLQDLQILRQL